MSDASKYYIGDAIDSVKTQGFRAAFINPLSYQVTVASHDSKFPFHSYTATFTLKNPDDARAFLDLVDKRPELRTMLRPHIEVVAKAIELLNESQKLGIGPFNPDATRYQNEKRDDMYKWDAPLEYGRKRVEYEKKRDRSLVERIAAMREYKDSDKVRNAAVAMGVKVPPQEDKGISKPINKYLEAQRRAAGI